MVKYYALQDGPDFYLYNDSQCKDLHNTLSYPKPLGLDLTLALKARQWFEALMRESGLTYTWANPFVSEPATSRKPAPATYTGKPASSVTRMVDMSAYTGDDLEF